MRTLVLAGVLIALVATPALACRGAEPTTSTGINLINYTQEGIAAIKDSPKRHHA